MKKYIVYKVTNKINGKIYIGKTYNLEKRKKEHFNGINDNSPFHKALKKYGIGNFEWEVIDNADTEKEILDKEIYWIKKLNTCIHFHNSNGYNITLGGEGGSSWNSKPVLQFDLEGNYIKEYISCSQASIETGIGRHNISDCANGITKQSGGFQWIYKYECKNNKLTPLKKKPSEKRKKIVQLNLQGNLIDIFDSVSNASEKTGIRRANISSCLTKRAATSGGFQWIYEKDYNPNGNYKYKGVMRGNGIVQLDENLSLLNYFKNCSEAARFLGEPISIHKQINKATKNGKRCRGFYWKKFEDYIITQQGNTEVTL